MLLKRPPVYHQSVKTGGRDDWGTPWYIVQAAELLIGNSFGLDAACSSENQKAPRGLSHGALEADWTQHGLVWLNPPYSRCKQFMAKAKHEGTKSSSPGVVCLVPARTDTRWFHESVLDGAAFVWLIKGRIKFEGATAGAPFPSALVYYRPNPPVTPCFLPLTLKDTK